MKTALFGYCIFFLFLISACSKLEKTDAPVDYPAAYVINGESNSISIINIESDELVQSCQFKKGSWPHHIYSNSTEDKLVVSLVGTDLSSGHAGHGEADDSYLMILDASNLKILACTKTNSATHNAIFMNSDEEVWITEMEDQGTILKLDAKSLKEKGSIAVGSTPLEITKDPNGTYVFVANGSGNSISVVSAATGEVVKTIPVGLEPVGAWPASNNKMYVDCEVSKQIYEIDVTTLTVTDTIALTYTPAYVAYNQTLSELWVSDAQNGGVHNYQLVAGSWVEQAFLATGSNAHAIAFNADYSKAYVTNQGQGNVSVINPTTFVKIKDITVETKPNGIYIRD
ncbi:MAG: YncE family protein [Bacteroidetes bacterium]|nr:YncE family protein [Bacteroidota bacterium]